MCNVLPLKLIKRKIDGFGSFFIYDVRFPFFSPKPPKINQKEPTLTVPRRNSQAVVLYQASKPGALLH